MATVTSPGVHQKEAAPGIQTAVPARRDGGRSNPLTTRTASRWGAGLAVLALFSCSVGAAGLKPVGLRAEYLADPVGLDTPVPRLSWRVESATRGQKQTAYRIVVTSSAQSLKREEGDLWDSGSVPGDASVNVVYAGRPLASGQRCFWKVKTWDKDGRASAWSEPAAWAMGLLKPEDWRAQWISFQDSAPVPSDRKNLLLPPARHFRQEFKTAQAVKRATVYASALGVVDLHLNGRRVSEAYFEPGWSDYLKRAYYRSHDVTALVRQGGNVLGAVVADGWYAGYVGYGLLVGYGPNKTGRCFYGKSPALLVQLELEFADGSRQTVVSDLAWKVTSQGPIREADLIMGEACDARREMPGWDEPGFDDRGWENAIRAEDNGRSKATFYDNCGAREVELGFQRPARMQAYCAPPIRVTQELKAQRVTEPKPGVFVFDFGQNFAGNIRLKVKGPAGARVQLRYGEMLHPDGRLMVENLRRARATDFYTLRGKPGGETWTPRFTYHGFQFVEVTGLPSRPSLATVTGLVLHSDTPLVGSFACSDEVMTRFWKNTTWTQRANFIEIPTDCPQRDERLGWMGDAQVYVRTATYNADVAAFFTKWLDDLEEAQRDFGAYPDYSPYPMGHGTPNQTWGTAWTDAGIICPYTIWQVYGDTRVLERHWASMARFMEWRKQRAPDGRGRKDGNSWGDWLNVNEPTPLELIDAAYYKWDAHLMAQMARTVGRDKEAEAYRELEKRIAAQFAQDYLTPEGALKVKTQTALVLALAFGLTSGPGLETGGAQLAERIAQNGCLMATGFLGTKALLPALSASGQHDLAVRLFQSRKFPSWGYEVMNGANSVWERWDSFTREHGFNGAGGDQNASMNSFSHYSFGAVMEWGFRNLAGIDTDGPGYKRILIRPGPPAPGSNPDNPPINWVKAEYGSIHGPIVSEWKRAADRFELVVTIPANTTATVFLPATGPAGITEAGKPLDRVDGVKFLRMEGACAVLAVDSGKYRFAATVK
jgi:alpha-L-rhamnosidase